jgi:predicted Zn-dependent protease
MTRLDAVVEGSPCDETEVVWIEVVRSEVSSGRVRTPPQPWLETTVLIRVREQGRIGVYRTGGGSGGELAAAVRQALGHSRIQPPSSWASAPAGPEERVEPRSDLVDRELATLDPERARSELTRHTRKGEVGRLAWSVGRVLLVNSRGLRQQAAATSATLLARCRRLPGAGRAMISTRGLEDLMPEQIFERARVRCAPEASEGDPGTTEGPLPVVLAPEAVAALLDLLSRQALSAESFKAGTSFCRDRLGERLLDSALTLVDDATDPRGLPFPFDLCGWASRPVEMIRTGEIITPSVDDELAASLGRPRTPHAVSGGELRPCHLFLTPGELGDEELLRRADGGLWIGWLDRLASSATGAGEFRAVAREVRRIRGGELGAAVSDLVWEDTLPRVFGELAGVGRQPVCVAVEDGFRGGVSAPALALPPVSGLRPVEPDEQPAAHTRSPSPRVR